MVTSGTFNRLAPMLFLIDTGGPNLGFDTTASMAVAAGVVLDQSKARRMILGILNGRPNEVTAIPFVVNRLTLGAAVNCDLPGLARASDSPQLMLGSQIRNVTPRSSSSFAGDLRIPRHAPHHKRHSAVMWIGLLATVEYQASDCRAA